MEVDGIKIEYRVNGEQRRPTKEEAEQMLTRMMDVLGYDKVEKEKEPAAGQRRGTWRGRPDGGQ